jgi:integrase
MPTGTGSAPLSNTAICSAVVEWLTPRRSPNTVYSYRQTYVSLLAAVDVPLSTVTPDVLSAWLHRPRRGGTAAPASVRKDLAALRALFKYMGTRGLIEGADPTVLLLEDAPKVHNEQPKPIPLADWRRVWFADLDDPSRVLLGLGCFVGLRRAEIASLSPSQVTSDPARLLGVKRKGGKRQGFHYDTCLDVYAEVLPEWIGDPDELFRRPLGRLVAARADKVALLPYADQRESRYITRTIHTAPPGTVNPDLCGKRLTRLLKGLGEPPGLFTLHQLRHSFCTNLCTAGVPIEVVSQLAGHSSLDITRRYIELGEDPLARFLTKRVTASEHLATVNRWAE